MPFRSPRRLVTLVLLLAPLFSACSPDDDIGETWVSGASTQKVSWIAWSPDATTLYWINGGINSIPGTLYAMPAANRRPLAAATGVWGHPTLTTDGREIFYTTSDPASGAASLNVATIGSDGTSLTAPRVLATNFFSCLVAPDGTRVALVDGTTSDTTVQEVAGGATVDLGRGLEPLTFSPDGGALLARNAASNDASTHYALADTSTGAITYLPFPADETIWLVTAWTGESPSVVIVNQVIDLATGATMKLPGLGQVDALSGTPAPTLAYGWGDLACLGPYTDDAGDALCDGEYEGLSRDDLRTGAHDVIAAETVQRLNNSDLFAVSPDGAWLAIAAGSGVIGEASSTAITVKHLSPPAGAAAP
jgi:hypothetical protein